MRTLAITCVAFVVLMATAWTIGRVVMAASDDDPNVAILDDCDPTDPTWADIGGCTLKPQEGDVNRNEFFALAFSPRGPGVLIGHPSRRNEPSHLSVDPRKTVRIVNRGGRAHTFTEVAEFGGGRFAPLNGLLAPAQECLVAAPDIAPGERRQINISAGLHKFQCCIHPWMRATIRGK